MLKPELVIMSAGMGSRFGGLKQITPVDDFGHAIIDYSLYDARRAGFEKVIFVIKKEIESDFREIVGKRAEKSFDVHYVFQELDKLPNGFSIPEGRVKPWGTGHAVACCADVITAPFAVINADDFYGADAYRVLYGFLAENQNPGDCAMVGFPLRNTVTDAGTVARGVCVAENGYLRTITERTQIKKSGNDAIFTDESGTEHFLPGNTIVSMNFWGFDKNMSTILWERFPDFLEENLYVNPLKCEYFLPTIAGNRVNEGGCRVKMLYSTDSWYGMTYREDLPAVRTALAGLRDSGRYPGICDI